jgi:hypothetical protein
MKQSSIECLAERVRMISEEFYWELFEDVQHAKIMHEEEMIEVFHAGMYCGDESPNSGIAEEYYNERFNTKENLNNNTEKIASWRKEEDALNQRMNIVGQNGNTGEHYEQH